MDEPRDLRWTDFMSFSKQMLEGLKAVHELNSYARAISPRSFLISRNWRVKLVARPWSTLAARDLSVTRQELVYRAPETLKDRDPEFNEASDIWGAGMVLWGEFFSFHSLSLSLSLEADWSVVLSTYSHATECSNANSHPPIFRTRKPDQSQSALSTVRRRHKFVRR
jgi:serine/threonine protein kinase